MERRLSDAWEAEAESWVAWARAPEHDSYWRYRRDAFLDLVPPAGRLTLDVGCGEGRVARDLTARGHRVLALDRSQSLARSAAVCGGMLATLVADAAALPLPDDIADVVVAPMCLQDIEDLSGAVREMARVLMPGGRLCASIFHPLVSSGTVVGSEQRLMFTMDGDYFAARRTTDVVERGGLRMRFESMHRPLESYFIALEGAGLLVEAVREPRSPDWGPDAGGLRLPYAIDIRARHA